MRYPRFLFVVRGDPRYQWTRRRVLLCCAALLSAGVGCATLILAIDHHASRPDLKKFEPQRMGHLEASMWRSYYEGSWLRLIRETTQLARTQYGFSHWDAARLAFHAAQAARHFRSASDDPRILPALERYYAIIDRSLQLDLDLARAAQLELRWWQERRQHLPPADYGRTIAALTELVYALPKDSTLPAGIGRAEAMAYRDARRDGTMTEADWAHLAAQLTTAYNALHARVSR